MVFRIAARTRHGAAPLPSLGSMPPCGRTRATTVSTGATTCKLSIADNNSAETARVEIRLELCWRLVCCRQRDVAVRSNKVQRVQMESGAFHRGLPSEFVKRQATLAAYSTKFWRGSSVHVYLPGERCERGEVVCRALSVTIEPHPRQAVTAVDFARITFAQRAPAIAD